MHKIVSTSLLLYLVLIATAQDHRVYQKKEFNRGNDTLRYRLLLPFNYHADKSYPLIVLLHGAGERGSDNELQLTHGSQLFSDSTNRAKFPAIVIFPQCPLNDFWARISRDPKKNDSVGGFFFTSDQTAGKSLYLVGKLLDSFVVTKKADPERVYIGGLSMGGMGTFEILWRKPGFFAAAFPICGGGDPDKVALYAKKFPVWVFHGDHDPVVPVSNSRLMVNTLRQKGANVKYSEYPDIGHNSWDNAFAEPGLLPWLFDQKRK